VTPEETPLLAPRRQFLARSAAGIASTLALPLAASHAADAPQQSQPASATALTLQGTPKQIGCQYGKRFVDQIRQNLKTLLHAGVPRQDAGFRAWVKSQESIVAGRWPWYIEEMQGVAEAVGVPYEEILLLNLRSWQYQYYGAGPVSTGCSSLAITLSGGQVACAGALDDPIQLYCGPVHVVPDKGHRFISFPITGTSWANRGMNSEGLAVGISSQLLPQLRRLKHALIQDIAMRAILQTCGTAGEVREFCREHPFTMNLVCVDRHGGILLAQHTAAGLLELAPAAGACALTNHLVDDEHIYWLLERGVASIPESPTSRPRRGNLLAFIRSRNGKCTPEEVMRFIAARDDKNPGSIHNRGSIYLTYSCPQASRDTFWIMQPKAPQNPPHFQPFRV